MSKKGGGLRTKPAAFWEKGAAFYQSVGSGVGSRLQRWAESTFLPIIPATFAIIVAIRTFYLTLPALPTPKTSSTGVGSVGSAGCFLRFAISIADAQSPIGPEERYQQGDGEHREEGGDERHLGRGTLTIICQQTSVSWLVGCEQTKSECLVRFHWA